MAFVKEVRNKLPTKNVLSIHFMVSSRTHRLDYGEAREKDTQITIRGKGRETCLKCKLPINIHSSL